MSPSNAELYNRLSTTAKDAADGSALVLDTAAQDYLGTLVSRAAEALGTDAQPDDVVRAEVSFQRLAAEVADRAASESDGEEHVLATFSVRASANQIEAALKGLCPGFFPFC